MWILTIREEELDSEKFLDLPGGSSSSSLLIKGRVSWGINDPASPSLLIRLDSGSIEEPCHAP